jgi:inosine-uridine nucleoside N-ribohydrolase
MSKKPTIILDTDIGYDPDDLFALLLLYKLVPDYNDQREFVLITANETEFRRLQFLRQVLHWMNDVSAQEVTVLPGYSLGMEKYTVQSLLEKKLPVAHSHNTAYKSYMASAANWSKVRPVIYIGIGGFTNLAKFIDEYPAEAKKMKIFMMGGALNYERYDGWIEYNVKIDPASVEKVINADLDITLIMAQTTHNPLYEVTQDSSLYKKLKQSTFPVHKLLCDHCDLWFEKREFKHGTAMHDPLTVATALGYDFVTIETAKVSIKDSKFVLDENGHTIKYSAPDSKAQEFMDFLEKTLC